MGEKTSKKGIIIAAIAAMVVLDIVVIGFVAFHFLGQNKDNKKLSKKETKTVATTETKLAKDGAKSILDDMEVDEEDWEADDNIELQLVVDGVKVWVPKEYYCFISPVVGPVVESEDVFQMKLVVKEDSYDKNMQDPKTRMEGVTDAGGTIKQEIEEEVINGKAYSYFLYELEGDDGMVIFTDAPSQSETFCAQCALETEDYMLVLNAFAKIAETAVVTDEANTTNDDLIEQESEANIGEKRTENTLTFSDKSVTYQVPSGFYYEMEYEDDEYSVQEYTTHDYDVSVKCQLSVEGIYGGNAKDYADYEVEFYNVAEDGEISVESVEINGYTCYYVIEKYEDEENGFQKLYAACDLKTGELYTVEVIVFEADEDIVFDTYEKFFDIRED